ncbi:bifunctional 3,4-dihydroxy-2-butanone-4-phosphate synthase/GTP cyclohydrolase II [Candidatus Viridilinea mediisalina]|uniref:Riboflavin biosynthesis protein RibBA n=1 Tax=Candidatus Viridilinea mediisalina TaxID=2024553 RepID=A0A2A6RDT9_9CHLR|nr:bifunctional 3,4-dihydroxy-2-butanone-4-phosphate synthase/GTP cyclohydrolase II [Candidatus Viridilinea mediisalina]PDW00003.1 bifunctional 3,4-dihydroxy-2-butanone-4-phosphate synthase/GTP cyclohydrolase II [Candidatus Viridilinea mediisalina]
MLHTIQEALHDYAAGKMVIVVDDEDRENEGDLVCAAQFATPATVAFMAREGRGLICLALEAAIADRLALPPMVAQNSSPFGTNFTVSIEAATGVTTGISAADRARTIQVAIDPASGPDDLVRPGHIFPLRAAAGGVLRRPGQTEAAVDLARLAGLTPAGVICEIMNDDGTMARMPDLERFALRHQLKIVSVAQLIAHRRRYDRLAEQTGVANLPTRHGLFQTMSYRSSYDDSEAVALVLGDLHTNPAPLVRLHSECLTGDVFGSLRCDCRDQLELALARIGEAGCGVVIYMRQEGRGIGLQNKLRAYALQEQGYDTVEANEYLGFAADLRDYTLGAQILHDLGVHTVRLMTNNPQKLTALQACGITVHERIPVGALPTLHNMAYLKTKRAKLGHWLEG